MVIKNRLTQGGSFYVFLNFFIVYPFNACFQSGLISPSCPWCVTDSKNFFYCRWQSTQLKLPWAEEMSKGICSFRHDLIQGTETVSSELLTIIPICFPLGSFLGRLSTLSCKGAGSGSGHLSALLRAAAVKFPTYDSSTAIRSYWINHFGWGDMIL